MLKAIKIFLLKLKIGYRFIYMITNKDCTFCTAHRVIGIRSFCDRYKFFVNLNYICNHFVPKQIPHNAELIKAQNQILGIFNTLKGIIYNIGGKNV